MLLKESLVEKKIKASLVKGKLPCVTALKIAQKVKISPNVVRQKADDLKIRISHCQLGCFQ